MKRIDFHLHTNHSDGIYSPAELVRICKARDLACIAVTDHDTISSFAEARREAEVLGIDIVPGIEISVAFKPGTMHMLGYFFDHEDASLAKGLKTIQEARSERNRIILERLEDAGVKIDYEELVDEACSGKPSFDGKQIGRPHFAKLLIRKKHAANWEEAFAKYLGQDGLAYVEDHRITSRFAIDLIHSAGGVVSLAHPKQLKLDSKDLEAEVAKLSSEGMDGIEIYNSCQSTEDHVTLLRLAKKFNLAPTGGSDFHGHHKAGFQPGFAGRDVRLGYDMVDELRSRLSKRAA